MFLTFKRMNLPLLASLKIASNTEWLRNIVRALQNPNRSTQRTFHLGYLGSLRKTSWTAQKHFVKKINTWKTGSCLQTRLYLSSMGKKLFSSDHCFKNSRNFTKQLSGKVESVMARKVLILIRNRQDKKEVQ